MLTPVRDQRVVVLVVIVVVLDPLAVLVPLDGGPGAGVHDANQLQLHAVIGLDVGLLRDDLGGVWKRGKEIVSFSCLRTHTYSWSHANCPGKSPGKENTRIMSDFVQKNFLTVIHLEHALRGH